MDAKTIRFLPNGLKGGKGKLQKAYLSHIERWTCGSRVIPDQIVVYGRHLEDFSSEVREVFEVENDSDSQTDYFEDDRIRIEPSHPLFVAAAAALVDSIARDIVRCVMKGADRYADEYRHNLESLNRWLQKLGKLEAVRDYMEV